MSTLQELLNLGLVAIGSDDSRLTKLEACGMVLVEHLRANPDLVAPATLIALDRDIEGDEPVLALVDQKLVNVWKTIRNTHLNTPRELLRSIIIYALSVLGADRPEMAALIWQTAFGPLNHNQARLGKESELVRKLLQDFQKRAENEAIARTRFSEPPLKKRRSRQPIESFTELQGADFAADIGRSVGPHDRKGRAFESPNPHWPSSGDPWSHEFTPRMTAALVKAVNLGMKQLLTPLGKAMQAQQDDLKQRLTSHLEAIRAQGSGKTQLDVLWWSEAKYSSSLRLGYRGMETAVAAVSMAQDLSVLVPTMAPTSVTHVLGEAVAAISQDNSSPALWSIETLLDALHTSNSNLQEVIPDIPATDGRVPLFHLVVKAIGGHRISRDEVSGKAGVDPELEISAPDFSMWVFRDIQALRLVEELT